MTRMTLDVRLGGRVSGRLMGRFVPLSVLGLLCGGGRDHRDDAPAAPTRRATRR